MQRQKQVLRVAKDDNSKSKGKTPACEVLQVFLAALAAKDDKF
jgi:hypothetical protein